MIGIYKIKNNVNNKIYIGRSIRIKKRWKEHIYLSTKKNTPHYNKILYKALRKYGLNNFSFTVLIECKKEDLLYYETYYYNVLNPEYNCLPPKEVYSNNLGTNLSMACKKAWLNKNQDMKNKAISNLNKYKGNRKIKRPIKAFNFKSKQYLSTFNSIWEAAQILMLHRSSISRVLKGEQKSTGEYYFEYV